MKKTAPIGKHKGKFPKPSKSKVKIYNKEIEKKIKKFFVTLDEASQRRFASLEAEKLGRGGKTYIHNLLGCQYKTIQKGNEELCLKTGALKSDSIRKPGGGRKSKVNDSKVNEIFLKVISTHTAGSPQVEDVKWTYLNQEEIVEKMRLEQVDVSRYVVRQLLPKHNFVKRKSQKKSIREKQKPK